MACSATACALTPAALARRMPCARSRSWSYWSTPALIDWMNLSLRAMSTSSFFHIIDTTSTSASGSACVSSSALHTCTWRDAGGAGREALGHAVGGVGKADGELVFGGEHGVVRMERQGDQNTRSGK